jgi:hypothetical protein
MIPHKSTVARWAKISPRKPWRASSGSRPEWSMWAWLSTTASMARGSTGKGSRLRASSAGPPWERPHSSSTVRPAHSMR